LAREGPAVKLIVITGMPGAGKSVAVEVARKLPLPVFSMGDRVREVVRSRGLNLTPDVVGAVASGERRAHGPAIWAKRTLTVIPPSTGLGVIDGARSAHEVDFFRRHAKADVHVLAIHSSPATREARLRARRRSDDKRTGTGFQERDRRELGWGIGEAIARADLLLVNEGSLPQFKREVARVLEGLAGRPTPARGTQGSRARRPRGRRGRGTASTKHT
jgi:dephospho-CoA kinase